MTAKKNRMLKTIIDVINKQCYILCTTNVPCVLTSSSAIFRSKVLSNKWESGAL